MDLSNISFFKMSPFNLWLNSSIFMDLIIFWSSSWMNLSSYGLVILIQRVVEPVHFMDLRLNLSTFLDLNFLIILLHECVLLRSCDFNSMCCWTRPLYGLEVEPVHFYGPHNFLIILLDELVYFWDEPVYFGRTFRSPSRGWVRPLCGLKNLRSSLMGWARPLCGLVFPNHPFGMNSSL